jgi:hypothetical protein
MTSWSLSRNSALWQNDNFDLVSTTEIRTVCDDTAEAAGRVRPRRGADGEVRQDPNRPINEVEYGYTDVINWLVYPKVGDSPPGCQNGGMAFYVTEHLHAQCTTADFYLEPVPLEGGSQDDPGRSKSSIVSKPEARGP